MSESNGAVKYGGKRLWMAGRWLVVPSVSTRYGRENWEKFKMFTEPGKTEDAQSRLTAAVDIIHAAMVRNYPDLTRDDVEDMVGMGDYLELIKVVYTVSGISETGPQPDGEGARAGASTGTISTLPLPSEPAGILSTSTASN